MSQHSFEKIVAWQKARDLAIYTYNTFRSSKDYEFKDQIQRAAVSVMNNIAEGLERYGSKELRRFLYIAKGSSGEVRSMLILAKDLRYIDQDTFDTGHDLASETSRVLAGFIKKLAPCA